jgi:hypothetical protein
VVFNRLSAIGNVKLGKAFNLACGLWQEFCQFGRSSAKGGVIQSLEQCQLLIKNIRAGKAIERGKHYVCLSVVDVPDNDIGSLMTKLFQGLPAVVTIDYLKTFF